MKLNLTLNQGLALIWIAVLLFFFAPMFLPICAFREFNSDYTLPTDKYNRMIEYAIEGNTSAMFLLEYHYFSLHKYAISDFYSYSYADKEYTLTDEDYEMFSKYAQEGNLSAKSRLADYREVIERKKKLLSNKDFAVECPPDDFCVKSDIYREYLQANTKSVSAPAPKPCGLFASIKKLFTCG